MFRLLRFVQFVKKLAKTWQGLFGVLLLVAFILVALFPFMFTSYNALGENPENPNVFLAGKIAAPSWLRSFPQYLGGIPSLSENTQFVEDPGLPKLKEWAPDGEWAFSADQGFTCRPSELGYPDELKVAWNTHPLKNGSIAVEYSSLAREVESSNSTPFAELSLSFFFPYEGPPARWTGNFEIMVSGSLKETGFLKVPITIRVFAQPENGSRFTLWRKTFIKPTGWVYPQLSRESSVSYLDSDSYEMRSADPRFAMPNDPVRQVFSVTPGAYVYGFEIYANNTLTATDEATSIVMLDDLMLDTLGTSWGLLGTDERGRDIFAQLVYGTRISLYVGVLVAVLSISIGLVVGLASGYMGGAVDQIAMRANDLLLVLPGLPMLIVLVAVLGARLENLIIFMGLLGWNGFARLVRSQTLSLKERPFVEAAKASGAGTAHILISHIVPNVMSLIYITLATSVPGAVTAEAALSFLGFYDPARMSWGRMLREATDAGALNAWWWIMPPGLMISLLAVAFIVLGFALDDVLNPKLRMRR